MTKRLFVGVLGHRNSGKSTTWNTLFGTTVRTGKYPRTLELYGGECVDVFIISGSACSTSNDRSYYNARVNSVPGPYVASDGYTQAWLDSCSRRYRSFDPASGTYIGFDGVVRPCVL